jgi:hypothetical protein
MTHRYETDRQVLEVIVRSSGSMLDDIALECLNLSWNQVFIAVDRLSREGALKLTPKGRGLYTIHLSNNAPHQALTPQIFESPSMKARA